MSRDIELNRTDTSVSRRLTSEEIDYIVNSAIPNTYPDIDLYDYAIRNIRRNVKEQLRDVEIIDSSLDELIDKISRAFILSKVPNGVYKGIQTSHVLGQFATQTTLHSKRGQQGAKTYVSAFDTIKEYVKFKAELKENIIYTFLKERIEYEKAFRRYVPMFTQVNLSQILLNYTLYDLNRIEEPPDMSWYQDYFEMGGKRPDDDRIFIRMTLDKDMIYSMKITMEVLISNLSRSFNDMVVMVPSPSYIGILDIYPVVSVLRESKLFKNQVIKKLASERETEDRLAKLFISGSIIPNFDNLQVSGISGVEYVFPVRISISSVLKTEKMIGLDQWGDKMWEILWDQVTAVNNGITSEDVKNLFRTIGIDPIQYDNIPDRLFIIGWGYPYSPMSIMKSIELVEGFRNYIQEQDDEWIMSYDTSVVTDRNDIDTVFKGLYDVEVEHLTDSSGISDNRVRIKGWNYQNDPQVELQRLAEEFKDQNELVYLEVHSLNYVDIMSHDKVDARRTITNNPRNVLNTLGIEALRNVMIVNIGKLLEQSGAEFNFRHIELLVDHFTMHGYPTPVSTIGIEGQRLGPFTESSFQEGDRVLLKAAQFGRTDNINTPSAYLTIGKRGAFGKDYNESLGTPISRDDYENQVYMQYRQENLTTEYIKNTPLEFSEYDIKMDEIAVNTVNPSEFTELFEDILKSNPVPASERLNDLTNVIQLRNPVNTPSLSINDRRLFVDQLRFMNMNYSTEFVVYIGRSVRHLGFLASLFPEVTFLVFGRGEIYTEDSYNILIERTRFDRDIPRDFNIVYYEDQYSDSINRDIGDTLANHTLVMISDIVRDNTSDSDLLLDLSRQYKWAYELSPDSALLSIKLPRWEGSLDVTPELQREISQLTRLEDGLSIDLLNDYNNRIFRYYSGSIMIQPWTGELSDRTSLYSNTQGIQVYPEDYIGRMTYYNILERPYRYHDNSSSNQEEGFDHCNDCSIENKVWTEYLETRDRMIQEDLIDDGPRTSVINLVKLLSSGPTQNVSLLSGRHGRFFTNPIDPSIIIV